MFEKSPISGNALKLRKAINFYSHIIKAFFNFVAYLKEITSWKLNKGSLRNTITKCASTLDSKRPFPDFLILENDFVMLFMTKDMEGRFIRLKSNHF